MGNCERAISMNCSNYENTYNNATISSTSTTNSATQSNIINLLTGRENIFRGAIWLVKLNNDVEGSEQGGIRPCVIVQNNTGNMFSGTTIIAPLTTSKIKTRIPTHVKIRKTQNNKLAEDSLLMCEQIKVVAIKRLLRFMGEIQENEYTDINNAIKTSVIE